jgi:hypothetical protein
MLANLSVPRRQVSRLGAQRHEEKIREESTLCAQVIITAGSADMARSTLTTEANVAAGSTIAGATKVIADVVAIITATIVAVVDTAFSVASTAERSAWPS